MNYFFKWRPSEFVSSLIVVLCGVMLLYAAALPFSLAQDQPELTIPRSVIPTPVPPNSLGLYPHAISFSPDGHKLASAEGNGSIRILNVATGHTLMTLKAYEGVLERLDPPIPKTGIRWTRHFGARKIRFSPDGKWLACLSDDSTMRIWDAATGAEAHKIHIQDYYRSNDISWSPDSRRIAISSPNGIITLWDAESGKQLSSFSAEVPASKDPGRVSVLREVLFTSDEQLLTGSYLQKGILLWNVSSEKQIRVFPLRNGFVQMDLCCGGKKLAVVDGIFASALIPGVKEDAYLIDLETGRRKKLGISALALTPFAVSPDGSMIAFVESKRHGWVTGRYEFHLKVYSVTRGQVLKTLGIENRDLDLAFSPDSKLLVASGKTIRIARFSQ